MDLRRETIGEIMEMLQEMRDSGTRMRSESLLGKTEGHTQESTEKVTERNLVLAVGHSRENDLGAVGADKETYEWHYNSKLAYKIATALPSHIKTTVINHYEGDTYSESMRWLKGKVDPLNAHLVCELHFNSSVNPKANGYEMLHWHSSTKGREAADNLIDAMSKGYRDRTNRRAKGVTKGGRGAGFLKGPNAPCVILEPFFGSNKPEWEFFISEQGMDKLAKTLAQGIAITLS